MGTWIFIYGKQVVVNKAKWGKISLVRGGVIEWESLFWKAWNNWVGPGLPAEMTAVTGERSWGSGLIMNFTKPLWKFRVAFKLYTHCFWLVTDEKQYPVLVKALAKKVCFLFERVLLTQVCGDTYTDVKKRVLCSYLVFSLYPWPPNSDATDQKNSAWERGSEI